MEHRNGAHKHPIDARKLPNATQKLPDDTCKLHFFFMIVAGNKVRLAARGKYAPGLTMESQVGNFLDSIRMGPAYCSRLLTTPGVNRSPAPQMSWDSH